MMSLTDEQLRHRLTAIGCDVGPIDDTTRPLYISLLKRRETDSKPPRQGRSSTTTATNGSTGKGRTGRSSRASSYVGLSSDEDDLAPRPTTTRRSTTVSQSRKSSQHNSPTTVNATATNRRKTTIMTTQDTSPVSQPSVSSTMYTVSPRHSSRDSSLFSAGLSPVRAPNESPPRNKYARRPLHPPNYSYSGSNGFSDDEHEYQSHQSTSTRRNGLPFASNVVTQAADPRSRRRRRSPTGVRAPTHPISKLLIGVTTIFFCGLGLLYYRLINPTSSSDDSELERIKYSICTSEKDQEPGINCISGTLLSSSIEAVKQIQTVLNDDNYEMLCGKGNQFLNNDGSLSFSKASSSAKLDDNVFNNAIYLIEENPDYGIEILKDDLQSSLKLKHYSAPIVCKIQRAVMQILYQLILLLAGIVMIVLSYWALQKRKTNQKERKRQINGLVEDITELLTNNAADNPETPYLAILEIRDKLLPSAAHNRKDLQLWEEVAKKFEAVETTRYAREKQRIRGEWFAVWRWLPPPNVNGLGKVWQGKAFDGSSRSEALTTCLKIRNMFVKMEEHGANWVDDVKRAIIEKCGPNHGIAHIHVAQESSEGLVFAKMISLKAAGDVYHKLHGSWFDGRLVTAKYLREERYHDKFIGSANCNEPMSID